MSNVIVFSTQGKREQSPKLVAVSGRCVWEMEDGKMRRESI